MISAARAATTVGSGSLESPVMCCLFSTRIDVGEVSTQVLNGQEATLRQAAIRVSPVVPMTAPREGAARLLRRRG